MRVDWDQWFYYDETSPSCLRWKVGRASGRWKNQLHVKAGDAAGCVNSSGYYQVKLNHRLTSCHIIIAEMVNGTDTEGLLVDHQDRNNLNNKADNLRVIPQAMNPRNCKKRKDNTSGVTGVSRISNGCGQYYWSARVETLDGKWLQKRFSITKMGEEEAFRLACEHRANMIVELNKQGAGYTESHGT